MIVKNPTPVAVRYARRRSPVAVSHPAYYHSGDLGDAIFSLPVVRAKGGGYFYLGPNSGQSPYETREKMTHERAALLLPLLRVQPYIQGTFYLPGMTKDVDYDLNQFRKLMVQCSQHTNLAWLHLRTFGLLASEMDEPWISVPSPIVIPGKPVVISKTLRYPGNLNWSRVVKNYGVQLIFLGLKEEHEDFCKHYGQVDYQPTPNLLEAARIIAGSELFISNQGGLHAVAEGLKVNLIQESHPDSHPAIFVRPNALYHLPDSLPQVGQPVVEIVTEKPLEISFRSEVDGFSGIGQTATEFMLGLRRLGHKVQCVPTRESRAFGKSDGRLDELRTTQIRNPVTLVYETTGQLYRNIKPGDIAFTLWESDVWPQVDVEALNRCKAVIVPCQWNADTLAASGCTQPIRIVPFGIDPVLFQPSQQGHPLSFGAAGRIAGAGGRKGIEQVIEAFVKAFPDDQTPRLNIKVFSDCPLPDTSGDSRIVVGRTYLTREGMAQWYQQNTAFVSASRGEGWSCCLHEAMACGCVPVACCYGGQAEFFDSSVGYEIPFTLERVDVDGSFLGHGRWAVPWVDSLASIMRRIAEKPDEVSSFSSLARQRAVSFSWDHAVDCLVKTVRELL